MTAQPKEYLEFIRLFNAGEFFKSHEVLEGLWRKTEGEDKLFYHGLIQAAVSFHQASKGNRKGLQYERTKAREKLEKFPARHLGVDVRKLLEDLERL